MGGTYKNGRIHLANREDEERNGARAVDESGKVRYNKHDLYTATSEFYRDVAPVDRHAFARSLANKTSDLADGEVKTVEIYGAKNVYWFQADGYMHGTMLKSISSDDTEGYRATRKEFRDGINANSEIINLWSNFVPTKRTGTGDDISYSRNGRGEGNADILLEGERESHRTGDQGRSVSNHHHDPKEIEELIAQLEAYVASRPKKPVIRKPAENLSVEEMIERLLEQLQDREQDNRVKHSRDVSEDAVELNQDEPEASRADANSRGKVKLSRKITPLTESDLQAYLRAGGRRNKSTIEALSRGKKIILTTSEETRSFINQAIEGESDLPNVA